MNYTYTIAIPHYNSIVLLNRMLASIPIREDIQIIIADDCSDTNEVEQLQKIIRPNLEIYYSSKNMGAGYQRNICIEHAKGKWFIVADCDDAFVSCAFDVLDNYKDTDYDYISYCSQWLNRDTLLRMNKYIVSDKSVRDYINKKSDANLQKFKFRNTAPWNKMTSLRFIKEHNISWENCRVNNDVLFSFQLALYAKKSLAIKDEIYQFIGSPNSITRGKRNLEREFLFYLQAQKRNGFFKKLGYGYPFYRADFLYVLHFLGKRGFEFTYQFFKYRKEHLDEVKKHRKMYVNFFKME